MESSDDNVINITETNEVIVNYVIPSAKLVTKFGLSLGVGRLLGPDKFFIDLSAEDTVSVGQNVLVKLTVLPTTYR